MSAIANIFFREPLVFDISAHVFLEQAKAALNKRGHHQVDNCRGNENLIGCKSLGHNCACHPGHVEQGYGTGQGGCLEHTDEIVAVGRNSKSDGDGGRYVQKPVALG